MKIKSLLIPVLSAAFAVSAFAGTPKAPVVCQPADEPLGITSTIGYDTNYVYRGINYAENLVTAAIDGNFAINDMLSINAGAWYGSSADDSFVLGGSYQELDLYAALMAKVGAATVGLKYQHYFFMGDGSALADIDEIGLLFAIAAGPLDVVAGAYYDFTAEGFYFETGVSHTFVINDRISLVPAALISYAAGFHDKTYYGIDGFCHVKLSLSAPIKLTKTATLTPYIAGNLPIDDLDALGEESRVYGGVSLSVSF